MPAVAQVALRMSAWMIHGLDEAAQEKKELDILAGGVAGLEQVVAVVGGQRPVVMLAGAVDAGKGFFMEQADEVMAQRPLSAWSP